MSQGHIASRDFENLYLKFKGKFIAIAKSYVHDEIVAEDIVSGCFARLWADREKIVITDLPEAYVLRSVRNACLNHMRDTAKRMQIDGERYNAMMAEADALQDEDIGIIFRDDIAAIFRDVMSRTSPLTRDIFYSSRFSNLTYKEIAELYGVTPRKVRREIQAVLALMRKSLKDYLPVYAVIFVLAGALLRFCERIVVF